MGLITMCSFRTPVNIMYAYLTDRPYKRNEMTYVDLVILAYFVFFCSVYGHFNKIETVEPFLVTVGLMHEDRPMSIFAANMMFNADTKDFRYDWVMAFFTTLILLKAILQFTFTNSFGPILKMITTMISQLLIFTVVWGMLLLLFSCVGQLIFFELKDFKDLTASLTYLIQAALGDWDMDPFLLKRKYSC